jgi:hypothetical protein
MAVLVELMIDYKRGMGAIASNQVVPFISSSLKSENPMLIFEKSATIMDKSESTQQGCVWLWEVPNDAIAGEF